MTRKARQLLASLVLSLAFLSLTAACGGGGGGGGGGGTPPPPPPTVPTAGITYTAASSASQNSFSLVRTNSSATEIILELRANGVSDVYGLGFDLTFPSSLLRFEEAMEDPWLSNNGNVQTSLLAEVVAGRLVTGFTRLGTVGGRTGSGALMTLRFTAIGSGSGSFDFSNLKVLDSTGGDAPIVWSGGSVTVQL